MMSERHLAHAALQMCKASREKAKQIMLYGSRSELSLQPVEAYTVMELQVKGLSSCYKSTASLFCTSLTFHSIPHHFSPVKAKTRQVPVECTFDPCQTLLLLPFSSSHPPPLPPGCGSSEGSACLSSLISPGPSTSCPVLYGCPRRTSPPP